MLSTQQIEILKLVLGDCVPTKRGKELYFHCPYCNFHKKKLAVNSDTGKFHCWKCGRRGTSIDKIIWRFGDSATKQRWDGFSSNSLDFDLWEEFFGEIVAEAKEVKLPDGYISLVDNFSDIEPRKYLASRGIGEKEICLYKIGYCKDDKDYANYIIFPSFDSNGHLNAFFARAYNKKPWPPHKFPEIEKKHIIFNELYLDFSQPIVLVEGVVDSIKAGFNALPLLGSEFNVDYAVFKRLINERVPFVYSALDPDAETKEARNISLLNRYGIEVKKIDIAGYKDPGVMTKEKFLEKKEEAFFVDDVYFLEKTIIGL